VGFSWNDKSDERPFWHKSAKGFVRRHHVRV
jgi:hypothetical protein